MIFNTSYETVKEYAKKLYYNVFPKDYERIKDDPQKHIPNFPVIELNEYQLGNGVLGMTFLDSSFTYVKNALPGDARKEVNLHEAEHQLDKNASEGEVRYRTKQKLTNPVYH